MAQPKPVGLEKPIFIERLVNMLPGSYFLKCVVFWVVFGTPGMVLTRYLDTFDISKAVALFDQLTLQNVFIFSMANFVMPLYAFYGIGHMRRSIIERIPELESVTTEGVKTLEKVFGSISKAAPAFFLSTLFAAVSIASFPGQTQHIAGYLSLIVKIVGFTFAMLAYGNFVWIYTSSIRGLHQLGKHHLRFVSFYVDSHLGMKSLGSLSLSFAWVYFLGTGLVFFSSNPVPIPLLLALLVLIISGIGLFFLPLHVVHEKMTSEKLVAEKLLRKHLTHIVTTLEDEDESSNQVADVLAFQLLEQKVSKISEWPFDNATLSWFSAIVIAVLGTIVTRYLLVFLGL